WWYLVTGDTSKAWDSELCVLFYRSGVRNPSRGSHPRGPPQGTRESIWRKQVDLRADSKNVCHCVWMERHCLPVFQCMRSGRRLGRAARARDSHYSDAIANGFGTAKLL